MNYEPNTTCWMPGDLVIHDADAKREDMLMLVLGRDGRGDFQTIYLNHNRLTDYTNIKDTPHGLQLRAKVLTIPGEVLHDPARFFGTYPAKTRERLPERAAKERTGILDSLICHLLVACSSRASYGFQLHLKYSPRDTARRWDLRLFGRSYRRETTNATLEEAVETLIRQSTGVTL